MAATGTDPRGLQALDPGRLNQGAATLLKARQEVGADRFEADLRSYLRANAHRVAHPDDLARGFAGEPHVPRLLRSAGGAA